MRKRICSLSLIMITTHLVGNDHIVKITFHRKSYDNINVTLQAADPAEELEAPLPENYSTILYLIKGHTYKFKASKTIAGRDIPMTATMIRPSTIKVSDHPTSYTIVYNREGSGRLDIVPGT